MDALQVPSAIAASRAAATACGLAVDDAVVLHDSNRIAVHLRPCDVLARVAPRDRRAGAEFEVQLARRLAATAAPAARLDSRVDPRVYDEGDFAVTLWTYHHPVTPSMLTPHEYATAISQLHAGLRETDLSGLAVPHFVDRVADAQRLIDDPENNPAIAGDDRALPRRALRATRRPILDRQGAANPATTSRMARREPRAGSASCGSPWAPDGRCERPPTVERHLPLTPLEVEHASRCTGCATSPSTPDGSPWSGSPAGALPSTLAGSASS